MKKIRPTKEELEHSQAIGDVREEAIQSVLCIRCMRHLNIGMQNTNEFSGGECGGCIAQERDDLQRQLAEATALASDAIETMRVFNLEYIDDRDMRDAIISKYDADQPKPQS